MLPTAIIVFREVLEAALIVGIVLAASRGALHRGFWVAGGIGAGVLGALGVAAGAASIAADSLRTSPASSSSRDRNVLVS